MRWFPGGAELLISGLAGDGIRGTWSMSTVGGDIRKLLDATTVALSRDGSRIAFVKQQTVWQMSLDGGESSPLFSIPGGVGIWGLAWSPDGRWLTYLHRRAGENEGAVLEAHSAGEGIAISVLEDAALRSFCWLGTAHIVLDRWEVQHQPFSNLWEIDVDVKKMKAQGKPRRLTNWAGFAIGSMNASSDGKRLVITKQLDQSDVFVGELSANGSKMDHINQITSDERIDWPGGWSRDGKWMLFQSDRSGYMSIYRQRLDSPNPEPLLTNQDDNRAPILSPDGKSVLYFAWTRSSTQVRAGRLMRMPVDGGTSEAILKVNGLPGNSQTSNYIVVPTTTVGQPAFRCPSAAGAPLTCVLSEAGQNEAVFHSFDPELGGSKSELFRVPAESPDDVTWDLSADGSRIAWFKRNPRSAAIQIRELGSGTTREITVAGFVELLSLSWAADGKSLFVTNFSPTGSSLLHVPLDGKQVVLYKGAKEVEMPKASPDGRFLAYGEVESASNAWLIEGIPR